MSGRKKQRHGPGLPQPQAVSREQMAAILERTRAVLSDEEHAILSSIVDTVALVQAELQAQDASLERLRRMIFGATTESTRNVLGERRGEPPAAASTDETPGHGRHGAAAYTGASPVMVRHPDLHSGEACPGCMSGKLYPQSEPAKLVRITGMAPLSATV
ncbi:ISSfl3 orfC, partial [mine drainage metagenome]